METDYLGKYQLTISSRTYLKFTTRSNEYISTFPRFSIDCIHLIWKYSKWIYHISKQWNLSKENNTLSQMIIIYSVSYCYYSPSNQFPRLQSVFTGFIVVLIFILVIIYWKMVPCCFMHRVKNDFCTYAVLFRYTIHCFRIHPYCTAIRNALI